jgi:CRP/FNR family cyclic AMP-dependent transcriptional regulator
VLGSACKGSALSLNVRTIIERNGLFRGLPPQTIARIAALASRRTYEAEAVVFMHGDPGDSLYGVVTGRVRISAGAPGGKEVVLNIMEPGDAFGEIALLDGQPRTAAATTLTSTQLMVIRRGEFLGLLRREPRLAVHLIELLCKRVRWTAQQMEDSSLLSAPARLAKRILSLALSQSRAVIGGKQIRISQEQLAQLVGLSRQIVNKHLQIWKRNHWISLGRGTIVVANARALHDLIRQG